MPYKILYIDDTQEELEKGTINGLEQGGEISIIFSKPNFWETQLDQIKSTIKDFDAIILDLRLNEKSFDGGANFAKYRGSSLAQELRTLSKESPTLKDYPIILVSADQYMEESLDQTSHDLFDLIIKKSHIGIKKNCLYPELQSRIKWLIQGYNNLFQAEKTPAATLNIENLGLIDFRFIEEWKTQLTKPIHVMAGFFTKKVIDKPSFLINELTLSARLGVRLDSKDWVVLKDKYLIDCKYKGIFSDTYDRWIMPAISQWWEEKISNNESLRVISSSRRVELLKDTLGLKSLTPLEKQGKSRSDSFWVICKARGYAIDTTDGFTLAKQEHIFPWQEREYISIDEALDQSIEENWNLVAPIEKDRLRSLQEIYKKSKTRGQK
ncbi:hypothetical protein SanaruYs_34600 [Chryseotalea sanaruensis]|uniref:Uncharacterized protein n=1 Tax=Chryseotalea sanaruensis TaxID=2482724 RepID=A0A401UEC3_9BACT|nr:hypothetical protein [Chryseotalea sanaruensis]GCC53217.1 hypothetical protein SanaruYs_34600 [Chryseotalea sanaruensis]